MYFNASNISVPSDQELKEISDDKGLKISDDKIRVYSRLLEGTAASYSRLEALPDVTLPVKYPRTPGYRPDPVENKYNAWYWRCEIHGSDSGLLKGKNIGIKDNIAVAGVKMMNGSQIMEGYTPDIDATVVTRVLDQGGVIVGKTTCENLCCSGASFLTTKGPVRNPINPDYNAGGSSSGSAVAVAAKDCDMAIGGDQGGSVRIPASMCGIVGMKPTYGLVPYTGALPIDYSLDHLGPMTQNVHDCALFLQAIAGYDDGRDPRQFPGILVHDYVSELSEPVSHLKIGLLKEGFSLCSQSVLEIVNRACKVITDSNEFAVVETASVPLHAEALNLFMPILMEGVYNDLIYGYGFGTGKSGVQPCGLTDRMFEGMQVRPDALPDVAKMAVLWGAHIRGKHGNHFYSKAQNWLYHLKCAYDKILQSYDVLVCPTLPHPATKLPNEGDDLFATIGGALDVIGNTAPFNATGHPAITLNAGFSFEEGLPVGIQIVGRHFEDSTVLKVASIFEKQLLQFQHHKRDD